MPKPLPPGVPAQFWVDYRKRIEDDLKTAKLNLAPLEAGEMTLGPQAGLTEKVIELQKQAIATYQAILQELDKGMML